MRIAAITTLLLCLIMFVACPKKQVDECATEQVNYDSLFSLGDSAIKQYYLEEAKEQIYRDSLSKEMLSFKDQLINREKVEAEIRQRVIFKDTTIIRRHIVRQVDTLRTIIRDTVYVEETIIIPIETKRKKKRNR
mgnify:CR=1 FL=1